PLPFGSQNVAIGEREALGTLGQPLPMLFDRAAALVLILLALREPLAKIRQPFAALGQGDLRRSDDRRLLLPPLLQADNLAGGGGHQAFQLGELLFAGGPLVDRGGQLLFSLSLPPLDSGQFGGRSLAVGLQSLPLLLVGLLAVAVLAEGLARLTMIGDK